MEFCCSDVNNFQTFDYVCAWYIETAAVLTGEQASLLASAVPPPTAPAATGRRKRRGKQGCLPSSPGFDQLDHAGRSGWYFVELLLSKGIKIHFAHRTFKWSDEASGKAAVYCVIVGFGY